MKKLIKLAFLLGILVLLSSKRIIIDSEENPSENSGDPQSDSKKSQDSKDSEKSTKKKSKKTKKTKKTSKTKKSCGNGKVSKKE